MKLLCSIEITFNDGRVALYEDVLHFEYRAAFVISIWKDLFVPEIISLKDVSNIKIFFT